MKARKPGAGGKSKSKNVRRIRMILGRTQAELAGALGVSAKAIQSYEQGWRRVPVRVMVQLLLLLALNTRPKKHAAPCWTIRRCDIKIREKCPAYTVGRGQFCWFLGRKTQRKCGKSSDNIIPCMECMVVQKLLRAKPVEC